MVARPARAGTESTRAGTELRCLWPFLQYSMLPFSAIETMEVSVEMCLACDTCVLQKPLPLGVVP